MLGANSLRQCTFQMRPNYETCWSDDLEDELKRRDEAEHLLSLIKNARREKVTDGGSDFQVKFQWLLAEEIDL